MWRQWPFLNGAEGAIDHPRSGQEVVWGELVLSRGQRG